MPDVMTSAPFQTAAAISYSAGCAPFGASFSHFQFIPSDHVSCTLRLSPLPHATSTRDAAASHATPILQRGVQPFGGDATRTSRRPVIVPPSPLRAIPTKPSPVATHASIRVDARPACVSPTNTSTPACVTTSPSRAATAEPVIGAPASSRAPSHTASTLPGASFVSANAITIRLRAPSYAAAPHDDRPRSFFVHFAPSVYAVARSSSSPSGT